MPNSVITPPSVYSTWDSAQSPLYDKYAIGNEYELEPGVLFLPLAENPPTDPVALAVWSPVVTVRIHAPYRKRIVSYDVKKKQTPPVLPSPSDSGRFVFLSGTVSMPTPTQNATLRHFDWTATGRYEMVENAAPGTAMVLGMAPWVYVTQSDNATQYGGGASGLILSVGLGALAGVAATAAGLDARVGLSQASTINTTIPTWTYNTPSLYPPGLFNDMLLIGGPG